jgi:hypothetical protein
LSFSDKDRSENSTSLENDIPSNVTP